MKQSSWHHMNYVYWRMFDPRRNVVLPQISWMCPPPCKVLSLVCPYVTSHPQKCMQFKAGYLIFTSMYMDAYGGQTLRNHVLSNSRSVIIHRSQDARDWFLEDTSSNTPIGLVERHLTHIQCSGSGPQILREATKATASVARGLWPLCPFETLP